MHERARLGRYDAVGEQLALAPRAGVEWQREPRLDRADGGERRGGAAPRPRNRPTRRLARGESGADISDPLRAFACSSRSFFDR